MRSRRLATGALLAICAIGGMGGKAAATTITIVNLDGPGEGLNDPTPVAPVGGNPGTTLGQQRLIALQYAADLWAERLDSSVEIRVAAGFVSQPSCNILGAGGPCGAFRDFAGAPTAGTYYPSAVADSHAGMDLDPGDCDVSIALNGRFDGGDCSQDYYYGLDGGGGAYEAVSTILHEFGHGLGVFNFVNSNTGAKFNGFDDAYMIHLEDHDTGAVFPVMTDGERLAAMLKGKAGDLHFVGPAAIASTGLLSKGFEPASNHLLVANYGDHTSRLLVPDDIMEERATSDYSLDVTTAILADVGWRRQVCGDGYDSSDEACDDGNTSAGDGCSPNCIVEPCWSCAGLICTPLGDGTACDDGSSCTGPDTCTAAACGGPPTNEGAACDDGSLCSGNDVCTSGACLGTAPLTGCVAPSAAGVATIELRDQLLPAKDKLKWKWTHGNVGKPDFGAPLTATIFALCIHDAVDGTIIEASAPPGSRWKETPKGFKYKVPATAPDAIRKIQLKADPAMATLQVASQGAALAMPPLGSALDLPLTVQLTNGINCWTSTFQNDVKVNEPGQFKAKND